MTDTENTKPKRERTAAKVYAEYSTGTEVVVRVWTSEVAALRSAVDAGNRVVSIQSGETLAEALTRTAAARG